MRKPFLLSSLVFLALAGLLSLASFGCQGHGQTDPMGASGVGGGGGGGATGTSPTFTPTSVIISLNPNCAAGSTANTFTFYNATGTWYANGCLQNFSCGSLTLLSSSTCTYYELNAELTSTTPVVSFPGVSFDKFINGHVDFDLFLNIAADVSYMGNGGYTWPTSGPMTLSASSNTHFHVPIAYAYSGKININKKIGNGLSEPFNLQIWPAPKGTTYPGGTPIGSVSNIIWTNQ